MHILVINGPNINMLGIREPDIYGKSGYGDLCSLINTYAQNNNLDIDIFQSNHEGKIVDRIQDALGRYDGIVINPAAYTHYSIAILDALKAVSIPTVEVHISDISKREPFRQTSVTSEAAELVIKGKGFNGYIEAIEYLTGKLIKP